MNAPDYGGGTPVSMCGDATWASPWAILEMAPKLVSLPVTMPDPGRATVAVEFKHNQVLKPGASLKTFRTFVAVHQGDYFQTLRDYRDVMVAQGRALRRRARKRIWSYLVRLGLRPEDQAQPDLRRAARS